MAVVEDIKELQEKIKAMELQGKVEEKKWKFPFGKKVGRGQKKKNFVTVMIIHENGHYDFKKYQIIDQTILHDTIPRLAAAGYVMFDKKGNPLVILPNWSVEPFSPMEHYQKSLINGTNSTGYKILMAKMLKEQIKGKAMESGWLKWIIGLALVAIIGYAFVTGGGK